MSYQITIAKHINVQHGEGRLMNDPTTTDVAVAALLMSVFINVNDSTNANTKPKGTTRRTDDEYNKWTEWRTDGQWKMDRFKYWFGVLTRWRYEEWLGD